MISKRSRALTCAFLFALSLFIPNSHATDPKTLDLLVDSIEKTEVPAVRLALLKGILSGLAGQRNVAPPAKWDNVKRMLAKSDNEEIRNLTNQLSQIFGDKDATKMAVAMLKDSKQELGKRRAALQSLITQRRIKSELLVELLADDAMRIDAIRGFASVEDTEAPTTLLSWIDQLEADGKRAIVETLAARKSYSAALLKAIEEGEVERSLIPIHVARSMEIHLGDSFTKVFGSIRQLDADREEQLKKYKAMLTEEVINTGSESRGRLVFEETCASCHMLYGSGAKIGPDLTGSNRANLDYILLNSIDPSYDVPDGYKMVIVLTVDGQLISGVIAEEDNQRLVLKTVENPRVIVPKVDIESRMVSSKSMMPDGQLEQMKPQQVVDLIKYLRTTEQVEVAK